MYQRIQQVDKSYSLRSFSCVAGGSMPKTEGARTKKSNQPFHLLDTVKFLVQFTSTTRSGSDEAEH